MTYDRDNIFAKILRQEIPCQKVLENDFGLAFHDVAPQAPVHVLAIPKGAYTCSFDFHQRASPEEIFAFYRFLGAVVEHLKLQERGHRLLSNQGKEGGQEVPHYHVHILGGAPLGPLLVRPRL